MKTISVIIPAYNASETLAKALESVLVQNVSGQAAADGSHGIEIIVVDDGSSDDTAAVAESYVRRYPATIRLLRQKNAGPAAARNAGVAAAEGDYIAFLDADDEWLPGKLKAQAALLDEDPGVDLVCTAMNGKRFMFRPVRFALSFNALVPNNLVYTSSVLVRKDAFEAAGGFDAARRLSEDFELWLKIARRGGVFVLNEPLVRHAEGGISSRLWPMERGELETYRIMLAEGYISRPAHMFLRWWSIAKYLIRKAKRVL